ncbi:hypothetical protein [Pseudanabaena mucicola]|uniref:Flagellar hook-length control protein FliK n=1 Tax=Pseudanabaena mucicola FACHB-723 TaxID=2692860 RepID=A0ABR8A188_9CYAN|nr:hypothetical protein [Pseudanabaena mucicola]MBD2189768.1 hypothetical protein [Pseudanabaena mucicola FACHB-723]
MSVFAPGTGGDLKSATLPAALLELATKVQLAEQAMTEPSDNIQISTNAEGNLVSISVSLPIEQSVATDGTIKIVATDYIV